MKSPSKSPFTAKSPEKDTPAKSSSTKKSTPIKTAPKINKRKLAELEQKVMLLFHFSVTFSGVNDHSNYLKGYRNPTESGQTEAKLRSRKVMATKSRRAIKVCKISCER